MGARVPSMIRNCRFKVQSLFSRPDHRVSASAWDGCLSGSWCARLAGGLAGGLSACRGRELRCVKDPEASCAQALVPSLTVNRSIVLHITQTGGRFDHRRFLGPAMPASTAHLRVPVVPDVPCSPCWARLPIGPCGPSASGLRLYDMWPHGALKRAIHVPESQLSTTH